MKHRFPKALKESPPIHKLIHDLSQEEYHNTSGTYSSSQFKDLLEDEEIFVNKYIKKSVEKVHIPAFDVGTYFHTGVLEPHKLDKECIAYEGKVRKGERWEAFKKKHSGKIILTPKQKDDSVRLIECVQNSPVAMGYVERGTPEVSFFCELLIHSGEIYAPFFKTRLTREGWVDGWLEKSDIKKAVKIVVKVRADSIDLEDNEFILDLKSTTGNARSANSMKTKISYYNYDLSASLYLDMFSLAVRSVINKFIWTFASKDMHNCKSYKASPTNVLVGRAKYMKAMLTLATCQANDWQIADSLGILEPQGYELEHIKESEADLL